MNAEMIDLQASIYSNGVIVNVFLYTGVGLFLPTIVICCLSIVLFRKGARIWHTLHSHHSETENISLRYDSLIVEYLRTYNAAFAISIVFVLLSIPCKFLRLIVLFAAHHGEHYLPSNSLLVDAHAQMQTLGHAFELSLYSYKCFVFILTNHRFRCALKYILRYERSHVIIDPRVPFKTSNNGHRHIQGSHSQESVPFEALYTHLQATEFDAPIHMERTTVMRTTTTTTTTNEITPSDRYDHQSSFKTRSSISSRRTKEDEISL
jgi:hypothetical protein